MKFWVGCTFLPPEVLLDVARFADDAGYYGAFLSDHPAFPERIDTPYPYSSDGKMGFDHTIPYPDAWIGIAAMAAVTKQLHFSTNVFIAAARHPLVVAKALSTAAVLSNNRVALGLAAGWMREEFAAMDQEFSNRGKRLDESIEIYRALWAGGAVEHHGKYYDFPRLRVSPAPSAPIPIYCGGISDAAVKRAATLCDGWIGTLQDIEQLREFVAKLDRMREEAGRDPDPNFEVFGGISGPPTVDAYRRLEEAGVTSTTVAPWHLVPDAAEGFTPDRLKRALEDFAENIVSKFPSPRG
jgi:probable F420-dependent oxidoreductase